MVFHKVPFMVKHSLIYIYINDLPYISNSCFLESYVDYSKPYLSFSVKDAEDAAARLDADLQRIAAWCCSHIVS